MWGATLKTVILTFIYFYFNPRSPCGERLQNPFFVSTSLIFQSTLPVWGATAPLSLPPCPICISIHAPRVGSDLPRLLCRLPAWQFQSTLPVWGATSQLFSWSVRYQNFNPRSPCGERQQKYPKIFLKKAIYCAKAKMIASIYLLFLLCILSYSTEIWCEHH